MKIIAINKLYTKNITILCLIYSYFISITYSRKIILIQNAEPDEHDSNILSLTGEARSICLNELFQKDNGLKPQLIYAQNPHGDVYTPLPLQTVNYIATKQNIEVNDTYKERQQAKLASNIENLPDEIETVLLCWNRYQIELLVRTLGIDDPPTWNDGYDNLWIVEDDSLNDTTQNLSGCINRVKADLISGIPYSIRKPNILIYLLFLIATFYFL